VGSLSRFAAPAAFLAAVTLAVLLIRGALRDDAPARPSAAVAQSAAPASPPASPRRTTTAAPAAEGRFHAIRAGETLGAVAGRYETTVAALVELNPDIDPVALQVGQRVRVK
jgi:Tfp pilus assembly protein FimV